MKKVLFIHGFTSSGDCEIARVLKEELRGVADVVAPDVALHPYEAMAQLLDICDSMRCDLIVGSSCGAFYGQQIVRLIGCPAVLISPFLKMTDFLEPRLGWHEYKSPRKDGVQKFEITQELVAEFAKMQSEQFDCYDKYNRDRVVGMFGSEDTLAHYRDIFERYYSTAIDYDGPHTMMSDNVRHDLVPAIRRMLEKFPRKEARYFRHFKGNCYRLCHAAKDSEAQQRLVVYQALYGQHGYWVRPERMFFERIIRDGKEFPRFAEIRSDVKVMSDEVSFIGIRIRKTEEPDIPEVMRIFDEARRYMRSEGNLTQWTDAYPSEAQLHSGIEAGGSHVIEQDGKIGATFFFTQEGEPTYRVIKHGDWLDDAPYGVIHRIASDGSISGILRSVLDYCFTHTDNIRIDTHRDNRTMQFGLLRYGFRYCGIINLANGDERLAYQLHK